MTALVAAVALLTNLPPGKLSVGSAVAAGGQPAAPSGGPARIALEGGNALVVWPGTAGSNALALRLKGGAKTAEALLELPDGSTRTVTLDRTAPRRVLGLRRRSPGRHDQRDHRLRIGDARRQAADRQGLRRPRRRPGTRAGRRTGRRRGGRPGRRGAAHRRRAGAHHRAGARRQRAPRRARPGQRQAGAALPEDGRGVLHHPRPGGRYAAAPVDRAAGRQGGLGAAAGCPPRTRPPPSRSSGGRGRRCCRGRRW